MFLRGTTDFNPASSGNIDTYNNRARDTAAAGHSEIQALDTASGDSFRSKFRALISTGAVHARDNTGTTGTGVPIYWLNGEKVADNYADLYDGDWDSLEGRDENGDTITSIAWTGSLANGTGESGLQAGSGGNVRSGNLATLGSELHGDTFDGNRNASLYILSPLLTVATPPPPPPPPVLNTDASLEYLRFAPSSEIVMQPAFSPGVYDYTASMANSAGIPISANGVDLSHVIRMAAGVNDVDGATFGFTLTQLDQGPMPFSLDATEFTFNLELTSDGVQSTTGGTAIIEIMVTAESGATQTYTTTIYIRAPVPAAPVSQVLPADWDLKPAAVAAGQPFRLMFLNTGGRPGSRSIEFYNGNSQNNRDGAGGGHASIRGFAGEFRALISTAAVDARDNTATTGDGVPIYWLDGEKVADNYADFYDGSWDSRSPKDRLGADLSNAYEVLTGTNADGRGDLQFLPDGGPYRIGRLNQGEGAEIHSDMTVPNGDSRAQYALSPVLTVAAPGDAATAAVLDDLSISAGELSPPFVSTTLFYNVVVPSGTATFMLTPSVSADRTNHQLISISAIHDGVETLPATPLASGTVASIPLNVGVNTISVNVIAAGAPAQIYTLLVTRLSDDTTLSALEVVPPTGAPSVAGRVGNTAEYRAGVANDVSSITLRPTTTHPDATVTVNGVPVPGLAPTVLPLNYFGDNFIQFTVIAANGVSFQTYTLTVNRRDPIPPPQAMQFLPFGSSLIPDGLQVGDVFRLMGVTNGVGSVHSEDIAIYNTATRNNVDRTRILL